MDTATRAQWEQLRSADGKARYEALSALLAVTEQPVDWAHEVWDGLIAGLAHPDNHQRAIAAQLLCNLTKSDPERRAVRDFDRLLAATRDERFVTARHTLQALWKVGTVSAEHRRLVVVGLSNRFREAATEKNGTLIRFDIVEGLRKLYDVVQDEAVREAALDLIATESDPTYQKKYAGVWRRK
jgi:hypothetical protein